MAVPGELTMPDLSGKYVINKIKQYNKDGVPHLDVSASVSGLPESQETRVLDFELRPRHDKLFGNIKGKSRVIKIAEHEIILEGGTQEDGEFLKSGFVDETGIQGYAESADGHNWRAEQVWGIQEIQGERRLVQKVVARKGSEVLRLRIIYDYVGSLE
ncbi:hypothetical protein DV738_g1232, partial [Chaetothyriales sp. CBS 135597]